MDLHKGRIGVFSRGEDKGCTFHIDIPIQEFAPSVSESMSLPEPDRCHHEGDHDDENGDDDKEQEEAEEKGDFDDGRYHDNEGSEAIRR